MTLPQLLLVDDSAAIVAFEAAALSGLYSLASASDGAEALAKIRELKPALVLLDLSMPIMNGDEVVAAVRADRSLDEVAIVIVSTEGARAEACIKAGANAYLPKPLKADELRATVARVLDAVSVKKESGSLAALFVTVGNVQLGLALRHIQAVTLMPASRPIASGPEFLSSMINFRGRPVAVLDLAKRLNLEWKLPIEDRKLVIVAVRDLAIAIAVDEVREPLLIAPGDTIERSAFGGAEHSPLSTTLEAIVHTPEGPVAVLDPAALVSPDRLANLGGALERIRNSKYPPPPGPDAHVITVPPLPPIPKGS